METQMGHKADGRFNRYVNVYKEQFSEPLSSCLRLIDDPITLTATAVHVSLQGFTSVLASLEQCVHSFNCQSNHLVFSLAATVSTTPCSSSTTNVSRTKNGPRSAAKPQRALPFRRRPDSKVAAIIAFLIARH
jgi:hypothetical protein